MKVAPIDEVRENSLHRLLNANQVCIDARHGNGLLTRFRPPTKVTMITLGGTVLFSLLSSVLACAGSGLLSWFLQARSGLA
jgi:hypothetical protein